MDQPDSQCDSPGHLGLGVVLQEIVTRDVGLLASMSVALSLRAVVDSCVKPFREPSSRLDTCGLQESMPQVKHHHMQDFTSSMRGSLRSCNDNCQVTAHCERQQLLWQRGTSAVTIRDDCICVNLKPGEQLQAKNPTRMANAECSDGIVG